VVRDNLCQVPLLIMDHCWIMYIQTSQQLMSHVTQQSAFTVIISQSLLQFNLNNCNCLAYTSISLIFFLLSSLIAALNFKHYLYE